MTFISRRAFVHVLTAAFALHTVATFAAESLDLSAHQGKVILVDFWASWCEPCRHSFPWLNDMQAKYGDRLVVIGVNVDRERADANRFLTEVPAHFKMIYDPTGEIASQYDVMGMPSSYLFDTTGKLVYKHIGFRKTQRTEREAQLRTLLSLPSARTDHE
jgi:cytochrome c biogenesis protein CcmG/thiol:disulfide interchange protein DsbE